MAVTLKDALYGNIRLVGSDCEHLGRKNWIYLSYDAKKGWGIVQFKGWIGYIQAFFRWIGLFYRSTHLSKVARQIQQEIAVPTALWHKINSCWARHGGGPTVWVPPTKLPPIHEPKRNYVWNVGGLLTAYRSKGHTVAIQFTEGDIRQPGTRAIVNPTNRTCFPLQINESPIHQAAGPSLKEECRQLPIVRSDYCDIRCEVGRAVMTTSHNLKEVGVERIIHTVLPQRGGWGEEKATEWRRNLRGTYWNILAVAANAMIRTIAIPDMAAEWGEEATEIAYRAIWDYVQAHEGQFDLIKLVFPRERMPVVRSLIDKITKAAR